MRGEHRKAIGYGLMFLCSIAIAVGIVAIIGQLHRWLHSVFGP